MHPEYDDLLDDLTKSSGVSREILGQVIGSVMKARASIPRSQIAEQLGLSQATVSKAVKVLLDPDTGLLEADEEHVDGPGRPTIPLRLDTERWGLLGVKIGHRLGRPAVLTGVVTTLNGHKVLARDTYELSESDSSQDALVARITDLVKGMAKQTGRSRGRRRGRMILGVGIEVGGHVHEDHVIYSTNNDWSGFPLGDRLTQSLKRPTIVENDINALALHEKWKQRYTEPDMAVIAVLEEGIGCGLVLAGQVYRGGHGLAGELGHVAVEYSDQSRQRRAPTLPAGFDEPCPCSGWGHLDALATPSRICGELRARGLHYKDLAAAAGAPASEEQAAAVFRRAGTALGRGISALLNVVNPTRVIVRLPPILAYSVPGTVGAEYVSAAKTAIREGNFSTGTADAQLDDPAAWEGLDDEGAASEGAIAFAVRVLDHFLEHTTRVGARDWCTSGPSAW